MRISKAKVKNSHVAAILPVMLALPMMYYPMVLPGDTQPWVFVGALFAFIFYKARLAIKTSDLLLLFVIALCLSSYWFRADDIYGAVRNTYTYIAFFVFFILCKRDSSKYLLTALKFTVVIWFFMGAYQALSLVLGLEPYVPGRFLAGRMGPPSLTPEASYYGSLSVLQIMILMSDRNKANIIFILLCVCSVLMSGSLLALLMMALPLSKLSIKGSISLVMLASFMLVYLSVDASSLNGRVATLMNLGGSFTQLLTDASLNLRAGHIYFSLVHNFLPSVLMSHDIDFMNQYNAFAGSTGILIDTKSNYILPALGELVYGGGVLAIILLFYLFREAVTNCESKKDALIKVGFIFVCLLNPISISNLFLVMYVCQKEVGYESVSNWHKRPRRILHDPKIAV